MTPKEKAKELVNKFEIYCDMDDPNGVLDWEECLKYNAKNCALIAVDEILSIKKEIWDDFHSEYFEYWQEVKEEIEKL